MYCAKNGLKALVCACLLWWTVGMQAQVTVEASIDSVQLLIGEQARLKLQVSMDAGKPFSLPHFNDTIVKGVEVMEEAKPDTQQLNGNKRWLVTREYTLTSFDSALYYLPPLEVKVDGQAYHSKSLALKVMSVPVDTAHADKFFGPKTIEEVPLTWQDVAPLVYAVLILLVAAGGMVFLILRYRDNKPIIKIIKVEPKLPPHQEAMRKIEEIKAQQMARREDPKTYYTELTDVIRNYIRERFGFNALEMTSAEIIDHLMQEKDKDSVAELRLLLETADLVKFAKHAPMINENDRNLLNAIDFINETKQEEDPNAKKGPTEVKVVEKRSKRGRIVLLCAIALAGIVALAAVYAAVSHVVDLFF